jgi:hypothetical protein
VYTDFQEEHTASIFRVNMSRVRNQVRYKQFTRRVVTRIHIRRRGDRPPIWANRRSELENDFSWPCGLECERLRIMD